MVLRHLLLIPSSAVRDSHDAMAVMSRPDSDNAPYTQSGRGIRSGFHGLITYWDTAAGYFPPLSFFPNSGSILRNADTAKVREHVSTTMMKNIR